MRISFGSRLAVLLLCCALASSAQQAGQDRLPISRNAVFEDISGMYSFLREGEFVQINLEPAGLTGYISREGDMESDRGQFLDHFFNKGSIHGHDVSFVTRPVHGVAFEFKGRFEHGSGKTRADDGYYVLRGTLTENRSDAASKTTSHSREVEFRSLALPDEK